MAPKTKSRTIRVGLLITFAVAVLMIFLFFIGSEQKIWSRKNEYEVRFPDVAGLAEGNPVKISGVTVGVVKDITLPQDPKQATVKIELLVDRKYAERIRGDSRARLKKLGLLAGDAYIDVTPGTSRYPELDPGAIIPAQKQTNVEQLISSGEDLVDNLVQISYSMKNILARVDRGEGLLGELTSTPETRQRITETLMTTLNKTNAIFSHIESGKGVVGKLVYDDKYGEELTASIASSANSMKAISANIERSFESGSGTIPALMNDPQGRKKVLDLVENLRATSENLAAFTTTMQKGEGLLPRLINDKAYGDLALSEFTALVHQLNDAVAKINAGQGTAGKLINDPSVYESVNDILIGINESKMLRWLIRNRQESGIERRYNQQQNAAGTKAVSKPEPEAPSVPVIVPATGTAPPATSTAPATTTNEPLPEPATTTASPAPPATSTAPPPATSTAPPPATSTAPPPATSTAPPPSTTTAPPPMLR